ncbi:MAG: UTP--glucose-1-phosphate uridylyltransferase GalU [Spirochaetota bacterium]|nr:UTP--glucose-1-phosphate uridylyltransferase GalU [Spirochaetota bacterium]
MVKKAVIPAAGYGTRFLPATKAQPKEMLPLVDKPVIQYVVEEAVASGIKDILLVIGRGKRALEEHFSRNFELEEQLLRNGKTAELEQIRGLPEDVHIHFVWQHEQKGLGDAVKCARHHVGNEAFALLLGDTVLESSADIPVTRQLIEIYNQYEEAVLALEEVPREKVSRYGVIDGTLLQERVYGIRALVEKPAADKAPSNLVIAARYVLPPEIFSALDMVRPGGAGGEIQLTDALQMLVQDRSIYGCHIRGRRHDLGNKLDWLKANILYGLKENDMSADLTAWLRQTLDQVGS